MIVEEKIILKKKTKMCLLSVAAIICIVLNSFFDEFRFIGIGVMYLTCFMLLILKNKE